MHDASGKVAAGDKRVLYGIQVLRGAGALLVVLYHAAQRVTGDSPTAFPHGQFGVDLFFIISGIVIYLTGRTLTAGAFLGRRLIRVVPLYWLLLVVTFAGDRVRGQHDGYQLTNYLFSFLFIPSHDQPTTVFPPVVVGWTLNYEMFFYVICTLAILLFGGARLLRVTTVAIVAAVLIGIVTAAALPWRSYPAAVLLLPITLEFVAGMWLGHMSRKGRAAPVWLAGLLLIAGVAWVVGAPTPRAYTEWRVLAWGVPAVVIVWAVMSTEDVVAYRRWKPALLLGDASYALYLVHQVVMGVLWAILGKLHLQQPTWAAYGLLVVAALVGGIVTHLAIERPLLTLLGRIFSVRRPARAAVASLEIAEQRAT